MIKLKKYLNRPTYAVDRPWTLALLNATTIGLILAIFEPFHYRLNSIIQFGVLCVFIGLTFIASVLGFVVAPKLFKRFYDPEQWTIKKTSYTASPSYCSWESAPLSTTIIFSLKPIFGMIWGHPNSTRYFALICLRHSLSVQFHLFLVFSL